MRLPRTSILFLFFTVLIHQNLAGSKPSIMVSIPPQKALVEALVKDEVEIAVLLQPGQSPANYTLSPKQLGHFANVNLYFAVGAPMEDFILPRIESNYPNIQIVDTSAGIRKRILDDHSHDDHHSDHGHSHVYDPHVWLSPGLIKIQLRHYSRKLKELLPDLSDTIDQRAKAFLEEVDLVDEELSGKLKELRGKTIFVYHPAFGYFLDRYGLRQETVELGGKQPSPKQLRKLIEKAKEQQVKVIFVQPQFQRRSAQALANAIGARVAEIDSLAGNYLENLRHMGEAIASSYR